ncbi:hypothetical protein NDU88_010438 [Pleurodeles waltl]|uniref:Uncharacterized protein n=1 Tax=Pleurodeles waltl TaxID=8319 RepID=A0AAV7QUI2_PLEWA|nr:hypothetical protein NDU88_010438 [Pleurodeles waltl]
MGGPVTGTRGGDWGREELNGLRAGPQQQGPEEDIQDIVGRRLKVVRLCIMGWDVEGEDGIVVRVSEIKVVEDGFNFFCE